MLRKEGKRYTFDSLEFYACNGMIRIVDHREKGQGKITDVDPVTFFARAEALFSEVKRQIYWDEKWKFMRMAQNVEEACKEAIDQGNPLDPRVREFRVRHREYRRILVRTGYGGNQMVVAENGILLPERLL